MEREDKESDAIPEEKADDAPSILPMTPESKQLAAVIATAAQSRRPPWLPTKTSSRALGCLCDTVVLSVGLSLWDKGGSLSAS